MVGFDVARGFVELGFLPGHRIEAACAIGFKGDPAMPPDPLRSREEPNSRRLLAELAFDSSFPL